MAQKPLLDIFFYSEKMANRLFTKFKKGVFKCKAFIYQPDHNYTQLTDFVEVTRHRIPISTKDKNAITPFCKGTDGKFLTVNELMEMKETEYLYIPFKAKYIRKDGNGHLGIKTEMKMDRPGISIAMWEFIDVIPASKCKGDAREWLETT